MYLILRTVRREIALSRTTLEVFEVLSAFTLCIFLSLYLPHHLINSFFLSLSFHQISILYISCTFLSLSLSLSIYSLHYSRSLRAVGAPRVGPAAGVVCTIDRILR